MEATAAADAITEFLQYKSNVCPNPDANPSLFQPCCDRFGGVCRSDRDWALVMRCVQQLDVCIDNSKLKGCCLFNFKVAQSSDSDSGSPLHSSWFILGCSGKRPLCHILGVLQPYTCVPGLVFVPAYTTHAGAPVHIQRRLMYWTLKTSHEVMLSIAKEVGGAPMQVDISVYDYECVGSLQHPNHFRCSPEPSHCFSIGSSIIVGKETVSRASNPKKVELGFGVVVQSGNEATSAKPKPVSRTGSKKSSDPMPDSGVVKAVKGIQEIGPSKPVELPAGSASSSSSSSSSGINAAASSSGDSEMLQDPFSIDLHKLSPAAEREVLGVARQLSCHEDDVRNAVLDSEASAVDNPNPEPVPTQAAKAASRKKVRFSQEIGISDLAIAKRAMVCYICNTQIQKGSLRFEYSYNTQKPSRSIHTECVAQILPEAIEPSRHWLNSQATCRNREESGYVRRALSVLDAARAMTQTLWQFEFWNVGSRCTVWLLDSIVLNFQCSAELCFVLVGKNEWGSMRQSDSQNFRCHIHLQTIIYTILYHHISYYILISYHIQYILHHINIDRHHIDNMQRSTIPMNLPQAFVPKQTAFFPKPMVFCRTPPTICFCSSIIFMMYNVT